MSNETYAIGTDIGGSHISCALVDLQNRSIVAQSHTEKKIDNQAPAEVILSGWADTIGATLTKVGIDKVAGIGFAMPGPFSYDKGIALFDHQVAKFESLYGMNIAGELNKKLALNKTLPMYFMNDASAFAVGEAWLGAASSVNRSVSITLGTGFGSAFVANGLPVVEGNGVPPMGCLWHVPFKEGIAEEAFATRWFTKRWKEIANEEVAGVKDIAEKAARHPHAKLLFSEYGANMGNFMGSWLSSFQAELLVIGGNVTGAYPLFGRYFQASLEEQSVPTRVEISELKEDAAIIGSARMFEPGYYEKLQPILPKM
jgi:glucokinase